MPAKLTGADKLLKALAAVEDEATDANIHRAAARTVLEAARPGSRSSRVRATGKASGVKKFGLVTFGSPATPWTGPSHFGHAHRKQGGYMTANPWLFAAADRTEDAVADLFEKALIDSLHRQGLT